MSAHAAEARTASRGRYHDLRPNHSPRARKASLEPFFKDEGQWNSTWASLSFEVPRAEAGK
jgi:hypothetical protein